VRENRTHGSEGGDGASRFRPYQEFKDFWIPLNSAGMTTKAVLDKVQTA
jgi:hypothetical protein